MTAKRLKLSTKLGALAAKSDKRLEDLSVVRSACDYIERLVQSIVVQSVKAVDIFINRNGVQLVDRFVSGWKAHMLEVSLTVFIR